MHIKCWIVPLSDWFLHSLYFLLIYALFCHHLNFEAAILDISELYVYDILHIAFLDYLNKIGHFDSLRYGFGLYKCHSQYSKWRPSWNPIWRPYGTFFSLAHILKRFSAFFSFRVPNFMLCSQSPRFFHQSAQLNTVRVLWHRVVSLSHSESITNILSCINIYFT